MSLLVPHAGCENPNVIEIADCCNLGLKLKADFEVLHCELLACTLNDIPSCQAACAVASLSIRREIALSACCAAQIVPARVVGPGPRACAAEE